MRSRFLLLGRVSPVLAGVRVFLEHEPLDVRTVTVTLSGTVTSVDSLRLYETETGRFLGLATADATEGQYSLKLASGVFRVPQAKDTPLYVRAQMKPYDGGGTGGQALAVRTVAVQGYGEWSNVSYTRTTTDTFPTFQTARARIKSIENAGDQTSPLVSGSDQLLSTLRFTAEEGDSGARPRIVSLVFQMEKSSTVGVTNPKLRVEGTSDAFLCTAASATITCSAIDESFGSMDGSLLLLRVYGDVSVGSLSNEFLRLTLNSPGSPSIPGSIAWSDGTSTFTWVPFDTPVVRGTYFSR